MKGEITKLEITKMRLLQKKYETNIRNDESVAVILSRQELLTLEESDTTGVIPAKECHRCENRDRNPAKHGRVYCKLLVKEE